jgi:hypothetical protein
MNEYAEEKLGLIVAYAVKTKKAELTEKTGQALKRRQKIGIEHLELVRLYIAQFADDNEMIDIIARSLLAIPTNEIPDNAVEILELAWQKSASDELWWNLWRILMFSGRFEQAHKITRVALDGGKPITPSALLEVFTRDLLAELGILVDQLNLYDEKKVVAAVKGIMKFRFFSSAMVDLVLLPLESLTRENNSELAALARDAVDHVRGCSRTCSAVIEKLLGIKRAADQEMVGESGIVSADHTALLGAAIDNVEAIDAPALSADAPANPADGAFDKTDSAVPDIVVGESVLPDSEPALVTGREEFSVGDLIAGISNENESFAETLPNDERGSKIKNRRRLLFAELDAFGPIEQPGSSWRQRFADSGSKKNYFHELD